MASSESESVDMMQSSSPSPSPVRKVPGRPKKSPVWDFFSYDPESNKSVCQIKAGTGGDEPGSSRASCDPIAGKFPTNLRNHLRKHHPSEYAEVLRKEKEVKLKKNEAKRKAFGPSKQLTLREYIDCKHNPTEIVQ